MNSIKVRRKSANLTQKMLAERMGVEQNTISQWESGSRMPRSYLLPKLADVLNCTVDELLRPAEKKENPA